MGEIDEFDEFTAVGTEGPEVDDGVTLRSAPDGSTYFWPANAPRGIKGLDMPSMAIAVNLQKQVQIRAGAGQQIEQLVGRARVLGVSWSVIGWCVGLTESGARKRFSEDEPS